MTTKRVRDPEKMREYQKRYRAQMTEEQKEKERERGRQYARKNKEKRRESWKKWQNENPEKIKKYYEDNKLHIRSRVKENAKQWRNSFFEMYGNKCECCGETELEFLTIDHIQGQKGIPKSQKERGIDAYRNACNEYRPDLYRTFCMNCNFATRQGEVCPHKKDN